MCDYIDCDTTYSTMNTNFKISDDLDQDDQLLNNLKL